MSSQQPVLLEQLTWPEIAALIADGNELAVLPIGATEQPRRHLPPELVRGDEIRDDPDRTDGLVLSYTVAETSVEGLTGAPSRGTAEAGARLFEAIVAALAERIERAKIEAAPLPD